MFDVKQNKTKFLISGPNVSQILFKLNLGKSQMKYLKILSLTLYYKIEFSLM